MRQHGTPFLIAVLLVLSGCGGDLRFARPLYPQPISDANLVSDIRTAVSAIPAAQSMHIVAARRMADAFLVLDVFVAVSKSAYGSTPYGDKAEGIFNRLAVFDGADGKGFVIETCDGRALPLATMDLRPPGGREPVDPSLVAGRFDRSARQIDVEGWEGFSCALISVPLKLSSEVHVGDCLRARFHEVRTQFGVKAAPEFVGLEVRPY